jgi:hypothetical protein
MIGHSSVIMPHSTAGGARDRTLLR